MVVLADTSTRLSLSELAGVAVDGDPASLSVLRADGSTAVLEPTDGTFDLSATRCPDLLVLSWESSGVTLRAAVEVVARQVCPVADILAWRYDEYQIQATQEQAEAARSRALEVIEREARRPLQPVVNRYVVDRPCTGRAQIPALDATEVVSVREQDGTASDVEIPVLSGGFLDMTGCRRGVFYEVAVEHGLRSVPAEAHDAVAALAAWYLSPRAAPDNATSESTDAGVINFVIGGVDGAATSIPEVNALISRVGLRGYVIA